VLRRIFGPRKEVVSKYGENYTIRNFIICTLHQMLYMGDQNKADETGLLASVGDVRNAYAILVGKPEDKKSVGRLKRTWEDNTEIHLEETGVGMWPGLMWLRIRSIGGLS
jgi:hypothetical protein